MFLSLWYYFSGYVIIKVTGYGVTRFINMLTYKGVYIWEVMHDENGVSLKISTKALSLVEHCAEKTACTMAIEGQGGLPYIVRTSKNRQFFAYGVLLFVIGLYLLSSVVWVVRVDGNSRVTTEIILDYCDEIGGKVGAIKKRIDTRDMTQKILAKFPEISWVSVGIDGTKLDIKVSESIEKTEIINKKDNQSIYANEKGVVTKVTVERGTPKVAEGDVVNVGDLLISSEILIGEADMEIPQTVEYTNAEGSVMARVWREIEKVVDLVYYEKIYTGDVGYNWVLEVGDFVVDAIKPNMENEFADIEIVDRIDIGIGEFGFGLALVKEEYAFYTTEEFSRTTEEAKEIIMKNMRNDLEDGLSAVGIIENIEITYEIHTNSIRGVGVGVIIEDIVN